MFLPILFALAAPSPNAPALPAWMSGCWESEAEDRYTEECWYEPRGKIMTGYSRSGTAGQLIEGEVMQFQLSAETPEGRHIARLFWAAPEGRTWTKFAWSPNRMPGITVYNVANDYPQRIRYWRDGEALMAEIALADGSKARRWRYRKISR